ncbi:MAG: hypothetical protein IKU42_00425 [Oscillospiraceae bacterium]|nr:hypothetical protein [Oscillospiraceae bacterium]
MKIIVFILALILALSGCNKPDESAVLEPIPEDENISEPEEPLKNSILTANSIFLSDANGMDFPEDRAFQPVIETGGNLYIVSDYSGYCLTKNDNTRIGPAVLYYKTAAGKVYHLSDIQVYDHQDPRISFNHVFDNIYSFCNPDEIMFFNLDTFTKIDFSLDFHKTEHRYHGFNCVSYDAETETYLLIFSVSDYEHADPNEAAPFHQIWNDESAKICLQRFASDGSYIDMTETNIPLNFINTLSSCCPNSYTGSSVEFFRKGGDYAVYDSYYHYDFDAKKLISLPAKDLFIFEDLTVIRSVWVYNEETGLYETTYSLLEHGAETSVLKLSAKQDFQTSDEMNFDTVHPDSVVMDIKNKTLEVRYGRAIHYLDFETEHAEYSYDYSMLTPDSAFAKSPDGKYELYCIGNSGLGGEYISIAAKDTETGKFIYLGEHLNWSYNFAVSDEHRLLFRSGNGIKYIDIPTEKSDILISYETIGEGFLCEAYDIENKRIIIASIVDLWDYEEFDMAEEAVKLQIFDFDGNLIDIIQTDIIPYYSGKAYGAYLNEMYVNGDGTVTIFDFYGIKDSSGCIDRTKESETINYLG